MPQNANDSSSPSPSKLPGGQAFDLAGLASYAEGSIVSRTLADSKAGTVTVFAFDAGQALSEHSAPFDAIVQVLEGAVDLSIGDKNVRAKAGQLVVMPANVPHAVRPGGRFKMLLTMLRA